MRSFEVSSGVFSATAFASVDVVDEAAVEAGEGSYDPEDVEAMLTGKSIDYMVCNKRRLEHVCACCLGYLVGMKCRCRTRGTKCVVGVTKRDKIRRCTSKERERNLGKWTTVRKK